mmetsp:Transcript_53090/g.133708  ORF Transcript_53090/g.133708 Transcript_53090/m.133708 type:complete len:314 (+) Transcript_53090:307-1248(+)
MAYLSLIPSAALFLRLPRIAGGLFVPKVLNECVAVGWAARAEGVRVDGHRHGVAPCKPVDGVQHGGEDPPGLAQLVRPHEIPLVAVDAVENEPFVGVGQSVNVESVVQAEVELCLLDLVAEPRLLAVDLHVHRLVRLHLDDELVPRQLAEQTARDVLELNPHLSHPLLQRLAGLHDEGDAGPSLVVDEHDQRRERGALRVSRHTGVVFISWRLAVLRSSVLTQHHMLRLDRSDLFEDLDLLVADVLIEQRRRPLHRHQCQHLQQVVLHDVADDPHLVEVAPTALRADVLLECDSEAVNVVVAPDGCEGDIAKP